MPLPPANALLRPMTAADLPTLISIGRRIWQEHYVPIIGQAQVDYMTAQRFTTDYLSRYLDATDKWLLLLELENETVGYCSYSLGPAADELKLEQLYLLPTHHGQGLGRLMLHHIQQQALQFDRPVLWLTVNKHNAASIAVYNKSGFTVREEAVFDIGNGYVMDDYVMEKRLA
ncbi:MAG: GNAT family N-acetyltransferase [Edaphobacter sp.]|uniref:GNAT family N-acetyltransferase n=1 Tax=Edaphobacter sp. TaxID=1934404 RepID=UPI0023A417CD|nr:GNAT family N-acetyltransferase [Edaphobacter sp.]MDE1175905.1 GNAT family N-acetyltransferase [Edaphobacter sp.]